MGLDCVPLGRAKPGHEKEWRALLHVLQKDSSDEATVKKFEAISIPAYATIGAPIVGQDAQADAFALTRKPKDSTQSDAEYLQELNGYHAVELLLGSCDGVPRYSNSFLNSGVDATSFRGAFFNVCRDVLDKATVEEAWTTTMSPEQAVDYGNRLLAAAERAKAGHPTGFSREPGAFQKLLRKIGLSTKPTEQEELKDQIDIVETAGRWYVFWGGRGHPVWAYF